MTREEKAIMYFKDMRKKFCEDYLLGIPKDSVAYKATMAEKEFYDTAIKALEQEPCEDANANQHNSNALNDVGQHTNALEVKTRHWIEEDMFDGDVAYRCSECDELFWIESGTPKDNGYNFCPKCGAKMVEEQESEG